MLFNNEFAGFVPSSFIFWSTLLIYQLSTRNSLRLLRRFTFEKISAHTLREIAVVSGVLIILISHLPFLNFPTVLGAGILGLLSIMYNLPERTLAAGILPLRRIPLLKVFIIAFVWAAISSLLPLTITQKTYLPNHVLIIFAAHFLFIMGITLPFDLRDFVNDQRQSLLTVPHVIGIFNTKVLALLSVLGFVIIMSFQINPIFLLPLIIISAILITKATSERHELYFTFWLDGTILLYFLLIYLSFQFQA